MTLLLNAEARGRNWRSAVKSPFMFLPYWMVGATLLYLLGWSDLFVALRGDTIGFVVFASALFAMLAFSRPIPEVTKSAVTINAWVVGLLTAYFVGAFVKNGGVPVLQILQGGDYDIYGFGLDGIHVFMLCLTGYYGVRSFRVFLVDLQWTLLAVTGWVFVLFVAIVNRSAASFLAFACAIVFVYVRRVSPIVLALVAVAGLCFAYLFGVLGDFRLSYQIEAATGVPGRSDAVVQLTHASSSFFASGVSPSWLWSYSYLASPLGNLNSAFAHAGGQLCGHSCELGSVVLHSLLPDSIGNRLGEMLGIVPVDRNPFLIAPNLTAATTFGTPVGGAGLLGGLLMLGWLAAVGIISLKILRGTALQIEGTAILGTVIFFSFFENMITYTSLSGELIIVLVCSRIGQLWMWFREMVSRKVPENPARAWVRL